MAAGAQFEGGVVVISHDSQLLARVCDDAERSEARPPAAHALLCHIVSARPRMHGMRACLKGPVRDLVAAALLSRHHGA